MHNSSLLFALQWCSAHSVGSVAVLVPKGSQGYKLAEKVALSWTECVEYTAHVLKSTQSLTDHQGPPRSNTNRHTVAAWATKAVRSRLLDNVPFRQAQEFRALKEISWLLDCVSRSIP